jgi:predicted O-methyltransferase YrrM
MAAGMTPPERAEGNAPDMYSTAEENFKRGQAAERVKLAETLTRLRAAASDDNYSAKQAYLVALLDVATAHDIKMTSTVVFTYAVRKGDS